MSPSLPPYSDTVRPKQLGILGALFALATMTFVARIYSRVHPCLNLSWDDFAISVAMVSLVDKHGLRPQLTLITRLLLLQGGP
jgi:hypothetical protein